ncbi:MAG: TerC family protein [Rhodocyclaceae bacterium]
MPVFSSAEFWIAVGQIVAIDIVLSGDNAVVIALACRNLPPAQRRLGIAWGVAGAVGLRVMLTAFAASLLGFPYLKLAGGLLLLWIGVKLLLPEDDGEHEIRAAASLAGAVRTIIVADFVMSLDNIIGVAAASRDSILLLVFGLALSIPIMMWTSQLVLRMMERFPIIVLLGAGLLGWVAGGMLVTDAAVKAATSAWPPATHYFASAIGAVLVVAAGKWIVARRRRAVDRKIV